MSTDSEHLRATLRKDLTAAMKARDANVVTALRTAIAAIDNAEAVEATHPTEPATSEHFAGAHVGLGVTEADRRNLSLEEVRQILESQIAEHETEADRYEVLGQSEAAARLRGQSEALRKYVSD